MARLTRTQKYADLRNQMENSRETQLNTQELARYEDKLEKSGADTLPGSETKTELNKALDTILEQVDAPAPTVTPKPAEETVTGQDQESTGPEPVARPDDVVDDISVSDLLGRDGFGKVVTSIDSDYLKDTLNEVKAYNKSIGSMTVEDVPTTILNEIRGISEEAKKETEDELSNTVTLEIKKILTEIEEPTVEEPAAKEPVAEEVASAPVPETEPVKKETPLVAEEVIKNIEPEPASKDIELEEMRRIADKLPKDVGDLLKQYLESTQEDIYSEPVTTPEPPQPEPQVEVQAQAQVEAEAEPLVAEDLGKTVVVETVDSLTEATEAPTVTMSQTSSLMNETMPLHVDKTGSMSRFEEEEDYDEASGSSRVLNIILVILIIILVAVLIVVAYLILVAQGIIPSLF